MTKNCPRCGYETYDEATLCHNCGKKFLNTGIFERLSNLLKFEKTPERQTAKSTKKDTDNSLASACQSPSCYYFMDSTFDCDVCGRHLKNSPMYRIPNIEFRRAVNNGFNPLKISSSEESSLYKLLYEQGKGDLFLKTWRNNALNKDMSDWGLCTICADALNKYMKK
jgi:hypothetical protein